MNYKVTILDNLDELKQEKKCIQNQLQKGFVDKKKDFQVLGYKIFMVTDDDKLNVLLYSTSCFTRASDLLRYLSEKESLFSSLEIKEEENSVDNVASYCMAEGKKNGTTETGGVYIKQIEAAIMLYEKSTVVIDARTFFEEQKDEILKWDQYMKVNLPRCYVSMSELNECLGLQNSDSMLLRTLENESGVVLKTDKDVIIMIGANGEPYDMPVEKFNELYETVNSEEQETGINVVKSGYEMEPIAILMSSGKEISLIDYAVLCQSKKRNEVYACLVKKNVKVFSARITGTNQYYYGNGEQESFYLTVDKDAQTSIHIVNRDVFEKSYELVRV